MNALYICVCWCAFTLDEIDDSIRVNNNGIPQGSVLGPCVFFARMFAYSM